MVGCTSSACSHGNNCAPGAQFGCGHFTQNIWKSTTHMCYQYAKGADDREYVVARYSPPGNFQTMYHTNLEGNTCSQLTPVLIQIIQILEIPVAVNKLIDS